MPGKPDSVDGSTSRLNQRALKRSWTCWYDAALYTSEGNTSGNRLNTASARTLPTEARSAEAEAEMDAEAAPALAS